MFYYSFHSRDKNISLQTKANTILQAKEKFAKYLNKKVFDLKGVFINLGTVENYPTKFITNEI